MLPWLIAVGLFIPMRNLERWLHQHIFKVGWLLTKNLQTTTILYYTFFLPGLVLNQTVYWLAAGIVNVRADRKLEFPRQQEIAELQLDFIELDKKQVNDIKLAIITTAPLLVALAAIWAIGTYIVPLDAAFAALGDAPLQNLPGAIGTLTTAPDFWLWVYIAFTIGNTMTPDWQDLRGWRVVVIAAGVALAVLLVLGTGDDLLAQFFVFVAPTLLNLLAAVFAFVIMSDLLMVAILGTVEAVIERITGDSATFEKGKLVVLTRAELLERRRQAAEKAAREQKKKEKATPTGPPSIYDFPLPIPDAPGKEPVPTPEIIVSKDIPPELPEGEPEAPPERPAPTIIGGSRPRPAPPEPPQTGEAAATEEPAEPAGERPAQPTIINRGGPRPAPDNTQSADEQADKPAAPARPMFPGRPPGIARPASPPPVTRAAASEPAQPDEKPAAPMRPAASLRPDSLTSRSPGSGSDTGDRPAQPASPRPPTFGAVPPRPPGATTPPVKAPTGDDAKPDEPPPDDKPAEPRRARPANLMGGLPQRPPGITAPPPRPSSGSPSQDDPDADDAGEERPAQPARPRSPVLTGRLMPPRPSAITPAADDSEDDDDSPDEPTYEPFEEPP